MRVLGIDEAGRGCVLGPMVVAGFIADDVAEERLRAVGADDSKKLSPEKRVAVRARLESVGLSDIRAVPATRIDEGNLNGIEERIIVDLVIAHRPDVVIVDALGHPRSLGTVMQRLAAQLPPHCAPRWIMEPRADGNHAVVGAASIFAKTTRDASLDELRPEFGDIGSGYPSDPVTKRWLADWQRTGRPWPGFVRTRWGTIRALAQSSMFGVPEPMVEPAEPLVPKQRKRRRT